MMTAPQLKVGILSAPEIRVTLLGIFSTRSTAVVTGPQTFRVSESGIAVDWHGESYAEVLLEPTSYSGDTFEIEGVTIGVDFHWQRKENQRFRGALRVTASGGQLSLVNIVDVEDYLVSVISSEMSATSSLPLLRAHAVISRGWVLAQIERRATVREPLRPLSPGVAVLKYWDREDHAGFDVCADDHCQRYQGISRVSTSTSASAVADTRGQVLTYGRELADTRFSKCCGGAMEVFETCWDDTPRPYLKGLRDDVLTERLPDLSREAEAERWIRHQPEAFCNTVTPAVLSQVLNGYDLETTDFYRWTEEISQEKLRGLVSARLGEDLGDIMELRPMVRGTSGRIRELKIVGTKGERVIGKELMIRRCLSDSHLRSSAFIVETIPAEDGGEVPAGFRLRGAGWGHGVGLCQIGAASMASRGYSHVEILRHYYPGAELCQAY